MKTNCFRLKHCENPDGFSMLEILVALALSGIILASMFQTSVYFERSVRRNDERIRAFFVAASVSAWFRRLPPERQSGYRNMEYHPVPAESGLRHASLFEWRIETGESAAVMLVRSPLSGTVSLPLAVTE